MTEWSVSCNKLKSCELRQFIIILFSMRMHITSFVILQLANKHNLCIYLSAYVVHYKNIQEQHPSVSAQAVVDV